MGTTCMHLQTWPKLMLIAFGKLRSYLQGTFIILPPVWKQGKQMHVTMCQSSEVQLVKQDSQVIIH